MRIWAARVLLFVGTLFVGYWAWSWYDAMRAQTVLGERLERLAKPEAPGPLTTASATRREAQETGLVGRIEIDRLGLSALIVDGTKRKALRRGVGHVESSAYPGEPGNVALAGHRDSYFRKLKNVLEGDVIRITTPDGVFSYAVDSLIVVPPRRGEYDDKDYGSGGLTLVTCYPFYFAGPAPDRFIVRARQLAATPATSNASN